MRSRFPTRISWTAASDRQPVSAGLPPAMSLATLLRTWPPDARLHLLPVGLLQGEAATAMTALGKARPLAGGPLAFPACEIRIAGHGRDARAIGDLAEIEAWIAGADAATRRRAGLLLDRLGSPRPWSDRTPRLMGIVNVTPDSFSDGSEHLDVPAAVAHALALAEAGAAILDIGGESTRPGAEPVSVETELARVAPVLEGLAAERRNRPGLLLSIDTRRAVVMRQALALGIDIINDVSALSDDPESLAVAAAARAQIVLMHKQGEPASMNIAPSYGDVVRDVFDQLERRVEACVAAGIEQSRLIVDPGIGFGKRSADNLALLRALPLYHGLGCPLLLGISRKALIHGVQKRLAPKERLPGSLAAAFHALEHGVQLLRVHDVAETRQVVDLWTQINYPGSGGRPT
jgi:dihydropteroate synthase